MRSIRICLLCLMSIFLLSGLSSCDNSSADVGRDDIKINIILNKVSSVFTPYLPNHMQMYSSGGVQSTIAVKVLIYGDDGKLMKQITKNISDYSVEALQLEEQISGASPLLVCFTYATITLDGKTYDAYSFSGVNSLSTLKVTSEFSMGLYTESIPWKLLGGAIVNLGNNSGEVNVPVGPLGGVAYYVWDNIHAHSGETNAPTMLRIWNHCNDYVMVKNKQFSFGTTLENSYAYYRDLHSISSYSYNTIQHPMFILSGDASVSGEGFYSPSNFAEEGDEVSYKYSNSKSINVKAGKQYIFTVDFDKYTVNLNEGVYH